MSKDGKSKIITIDREGIGIEVNDKIMEQYLKNPLLWISEVATGVATFEKKDFILTGGQLFQGLIKSDLWNEFLYQLNEARSKGKSKRNFYQSRRGRSNLNELFKYINKNDAPEEEVFKAMTAIFLNSIDISADAQEEIRAYHLLQTCKKLNSIDVLVLMSAYKLYMRNKSGEKLGVGSEKTWEETIANMIKLPVNLVTQSRNQHSGSGNSDHPLLFFVSNHSQINDMPNLGLTELGIDLAEGITRGSI